MITKNFKAIIATMLTANSGKGLVPVKTAKGYDRYFMPQFSSSSNFPYGVGNNAQFSSAYNSNGVYFGTGDTAPTENDYAMESIITSGLSAPAPTVTDGTDESGNPYRQIIFVLTNTTASDITVKEVGYVQGGYVVNTLGGTGASGERLLIDRTVLSTPITVPANGTAALKYTLKTIIS